MTITERIIEIIELTPDLTAEKIWRSSEAKKQTVKQILWRLTHSKKILRRKIKLAAPQGPQSVYVYKVNNETRTICQHSR
jgi:transcription initiation factor IIE alpha subunit